MEAIGSIKREKLSKNECSYEWNFRKVVFNKSKRSPMSDLPYKEIYGFHFAIVPDDLQHVIAFYIFLCGYEGWRSWQKMTFSASFQDKQWPKYTVSCSNICLDFEPAMKLFEIHSSHPIFFNCQEYIFKLELQLHNDLNLMSPTSSINVQDIKEDDRASSNQSIQGTKNKQYLEHPKELIQDFKSLFTSGEMCDLRICIGENILRAHKLILGARSPVFKRMMEHDCLESSSNSITITDCPALPFEIFLKYLYTGEIEDSTMDTVMTLYSLGDKYDVKTLRDACSNIMQSKIAFDSVSDVAGTICDVLQLAECHSDTKLKELAANFIVNHFPTVAEKQSWKELMKSDFELTSKILALVATGLHKKVYKTVQT